ncbi:uncharacterized protein ARMOST_18359 [Armillaria ostoyae]|uniref:Uncharacterized protein n=1 Tax=Armillaria ostoyae TaxID=47428 RepID=A0A284S1K3_ARMOS|nr:uncharacterized protein ARMOST_18359 [Armillaria ostoyae]
MPPAPPAPHVCNRKIALNTWGNIRSEALLREQRDCKANVEYLLIIPGSGCDESRQTPTYPTQVSAWHAAENRNDIKHCESGKG